MTLNEQAEEDVSTVFLAEDGFRQEIPYRPKGGTRRMIWAVAIQQPSEIRQEANHLVRHHIVRVFTSKSATDGITNPQMSDVIELDGKDYSYLRTSGNDPGSFFVDFSIPEILNAGPQQRYRL